MIYMHFVRRAIVLKWNASILETENKFLNWKVTLIIESLQINKANTINNYEYFWSCI